MLEKYISKLYCHNLYAKILFNEILMFKNDCCMEQAISISIKPMLHEGENVWGIEFDIFYTDIFYDKCTKILFVECEYAKLYYDNGFSENFLNSFIKFFSMFCEAQDSSGLPDIDLTFEQGKLGCKRHENFKTFKSRP